MLVRFHQAPVQLDVDSGRAAREERGAKSTLHPHASKQAVRLHHKTGANPTVSGRDTRRRWEREQTELSGVAGTIPVMVTKGTGTGRGISHVEPSRRELYGTALEGLTSMSKVAENMGAGGGG